jgi:hypothetical protein
MERQDRLVRSRSQGRLDGEHLIQSRDLEDTACHSGRTEDHQGIPLAGQVLVNRQNQGESRRIYKAEQADIEHDVVGDVGGHPRHHMPECRRRRIIQFALDSHPSLVVDVDNFNVQHWKLVQAHDGALGDFPGYVLQLHGLGLNSWQRPIGRLFHPSIGKSMGVTYSLQRRSWPTTFDEGDETPGAVVSERHDPLLAVDTSRSALPTPGSWMTLALPTDRRRGAPLFDGSTDRFASPIAPVDDSYPACGGINPHG